MDYISRYLQEVGKLIPKKVREEKLSELKTELEQAVLKKRSSSNIINMDEDADQIEVLNEYGDPALTAKRLGGGYRPLVSEHAMPSFVAVLKILMVVHMVLLVIAWTTTGFNIYKIPAIASDVFSQFLANSAIAVLIFHFLDRYGKLKTGKWTVKKLPALTSGDPVKVPSLLISVGINSFFLIYIALFPQWLGIGASINGEWEFSKLTGGFLIDYMPLIALLTISRILLSVVEIKKEFYTRKLRMWEITQGLLVIALCIFFLQQGSNLQFEDNQTFSAFIGPLKNGASTILAIIIIVTIFEIGKHLWKMFFKSSPQINL